MRATPPASQRARTSPSSGENASSSSPAYTPSAAPVDPPVSAAIEPLENTTVERGPVVQEPPRKLYDELVIPADSVIGLQVENAVTTERAKVEDQVRARVTRDVRVRDQVAIPAGARAEGSVTLVERGGRLKDQARLGIRFHTIVLADGTRLPINTETIYREGESPARESAAKIGGGAVGGAVLGAIFGGKKGAIIGSTVGAAGGGVAVAASEAERRDAAARIDRHGAHGLARDGDGGKIRTRALGTEARAGLRFPSPSPVRLLRFQPPPLHPLPIDLFQRNDAIQRKVRRVGVRISGRQSAKQPRQMRKVSGEQDVLRFSGDASRRSSWWGRSAEGRAPRRRPRADCSASSRLRRSAARVAFRCAR